MRHLRGKRLSRGKYASLSLFLGVADSQSDLEKSYALYFICARALGCNFYYWYGIVLLCDAFLLFLWNPISGYIADRYNPNHVVFVSIIVASVGAAAVYSGLLPIWLLFPIFEIRRCCIAQTLMSIWKAVKVSCEQACGDDLLAQEECISRVGTLADITTEVHETLTLAATYYLAIRVQDPFQWVLVCMFGNVLFTNVFVLVFSIFLLRSDIKESSKLPAGDSEEIETLLPSTPTSLHTKKKISRTWTMFCGYIAIRVKYMYTYALAFHPLMHSFLLYSMMCVVQYPLGMDDAKSEDTTPQPPPQLSNMCGGVLTIILEQSLLTMLMYSLCSLLYMFTLVKCPPIWYYRVVFPVFAVILGGGLVSMLIFYLPPSIAAAIVAVCTVVPYYLNSFDYYLCTSAVLPQYYGFFASTYGNVNSLIFTAPGLLIIIPAFSSKFALICLTLALLLSSTIYSVYFAVQHHVVLTQVHHPKPAAPLSIQ